MSTLLLRLAAPLQSWGNDSQYDTRRTQYEPTKSGIVGLLASALGRQRDENINDLMALHIAVRTDRQGELIRDFHIVRKMKGDKLDTSYVTHRYYLSDAVFLIGIEGDSKEKLEILQDALTHPAHPLFLGRRSCPPEGKVCLGIIDEPLRNAVENYPLLVKNDMASFPLQIMIDSEELIGGTYIRDNPISFNPFHRKYGYRLAKKYFIDDIRPEHDPMKDLR